MKRTRDRLLIHIVAGFALAVCLVFHDADAVRATALFKTTTTTTTSTTTTADPSAPEGGEVASNSTDPADPTDPNLIDNTEIKNLTGNPQIDYVHDPNLPRELNGYNLSAYPFLSTVPAMELINFTCDEQLHDGFYANVELKCQVYHQCLAGFRYDFLCANYTAFDQKTFICHFVSEVDCKNSHKFWKKNDDLYWYNTTTTQPTVKLEPRVIAPYLTQVRNDDFYKGFTSAPSVVRYTPEPPPGAPAPRRRRPLSRRRRPQYDYYEDDDFYPAAREEEDYYEEDRRPYGEGRGGSRRRKRPRPAQRRPAYDDDYEDDRYERRPESRTRQDEDDYEDKRPYDRPRKSGRRPAEDRDRSPTRKPADDDSRSSTFDRPRKPSRPSDDKRGSGDSDRKPYDDDRRSGDRPRRPLRDEDKKDERTKGRRDESPSKEEKSSKDDTTSSRDERPNKDRPLKNSDRPSRDDDKPSRNEGRSTTDSPTAKEESRSYAGDSKKQDTNDSGALKPAGASLFNKPRLPPRVARPVPKTEKNKYQYASSTTAVPKLPADEEYYDDYEVEDVKTTAASIKTSSFSRARPEQDRYKSPPQDRPRSNFNQDAPKRQLSGASGTFRNRRPEIIKDTRPLATDEDSYEDDVDPRPKRPNVYQNNRGRTESKYAPRKRPSKFEDEYYYDDEEPKSKVTNVKQERVTPRKEVQKTTTAAPIKEKEPESKEYDSFEDDVVEKDIPTTTQRLPFFSRNRPTETTTTTSTTTTTTEAPIEEKASTTKPIVRVVKRPFLPSRGGSPYLPRGLQPLGGKNFNKTSTTSSTSTTSTSTTTENVVIPDYIYDSDYDIKDDKPVESDAKYAEDTYSVEVSSEQLQENPLTTDIVESVRTVDVNKPNSVLENTGNSYNQRDQSFEDSNREKTLFDNNETSKFQKIKQQDYQASSKNQEYDNQQDIKGPIVPNIRYQKDNPQIKPTEKPFKASPQISDPYKPTNRPYSEKRIPENISIKQNLADSLENDYDVTINEALNPTLPNLAPIRNFPSPFSVPADRDYSFTRFRNNYNVPDNVPQYSNFQANVQSPPTHSRGNQRYTAQSHDSISSGSDSVGYVHGITVRTPQSFYIQQPRYSASFSHADETNAGLRPPSHVSYRHVNLADYL